MRRGWCRSWRSRGDKAMRRSARPLRLVALALAMACTACGSLLRTPYETPASTLPPAWDAPVPAGATQMRPDARWWRAFGDARLDALIEQALERNADLALAGLRMYRARLEAGAEDARGMPSLDLRTGASTKRNLKHGGSSVRGYEAGLALSYDVDLWGKLARTQEAAAWRAAASAFDLQATKLALVGEVSTLYWSIAELNTRIALAQADLADAERVLSLTRARRQAGAGSAIELALAERDTAATSAALERHLRQRDTQRLTLGKLLSAPVAAEAAAAYTLPSADLPELAPGLPATALARRPDVAAAETRMRATLNLYDASIADFYPKLTLTADATGRSSDLGQLFSNPFGTLGGGLMMPLLKWQALQMASDIARVNHDESVTTYQKTLYAALVEVNEAMVERESLGREAGEVRAALDAATRAEALSMARYVAGKGTLRAALDDGRARREASAAALTTRVNQLRAQMTLFRALGGTEEMTDPPAAAG
ncbi:efflux transporter outer membrane subunit [Cupriavidus pauculus]|uniref:Efflux transporter outer membrane subunit n=2 Tax=Cupriavidus pauculus TaxID=82633 RepID=A0A5P2H1Y2_9BURK|nr:efflux transporter outer membrane subunit [Cupriavidus pauculus]